MEVSVRFEVVLRVEMNKQETQLPKKEHLVKIPLFPSFIANPSIRMMLINANNN